ncbi:invasin domain 3-containing protein [Microbacterium sp. NPDC055665]
MGAICAGVLGTSPAQAAGEAISPGVIVTPGSPIERVTLTDRGTFQVYSAEFGQTFWGTEDAFGAASTVKATNPEEALSGVVGGAQTYGGSGTPADPFWLQTVNESDSLTLSTRLSYVIGANYVRTEMSTTNNASTTRPVELTGYGDCYLAGDDLGYSNVAPGTAECHTDQVDGEVISLIAATPGATAVGGHTIALYWAARQLPFITGSSMADTCYPNACMSTRTDNGAVLAWKKDLAPGESYSASYLVAYTDATNPPFSDLVVDAGAADPETPLREDAQYFVTVTNGGPADATNVAVSFALPTGMSFLDADQAGYDASTGNWAVGDLPTGGSKTLYINARATQVGPTTTQVTSATSINIDASPCVTGSSANCGPAVPVNVIAVPTAATSTIEVSPSSIPADGTTSSMVTVTARDVDGDPITVGGDTVTMSTDLGELGAVTDNGDGTYSAALTGTAAGTATITFTVNGANAINTATVDLVAASTAATSTIEVSPSSIPAGGTTGSTVTVTVRDFNGDPIGVGGDTVTIGTDLGDLTSVTDNGDGTYSAALTGMNAGTATITFTVNGANATNTATVNLIAVPTAATSTIEVSPSSIPADGTTGSTVTVTVRDLNGAPITVGGDTITMNTDLGDLSSVTDNGDGTYSAALTGMNAGTATITFTVNGANATNTATVNLIAVPTATTSTIAVSEGSIPADGTTGSTVTVTVRDYNGDPITVGGDTVTIGTDLGAVGAVTDNGDGTYSAVLTGTDAGTATITFTVNGVNATNTETVDLIAVPTATPAPETPDGLANTGGEAGIGWAVGGLLLGAGMLLPAMRKRRVTQD